MKIILALLFVLSTTLGIFLGRRVKSKEEMSRKLQVPRDYLIGLNFLLNEETDKAVDIFIKMLEVDSETVETHLAVGKLFRRRGEVDRAIRIHQNLIARPQLEKKYREEALYELGQDYLSAGMLDRAERIFLDLIHTKSHSTKAYETLMDIYQQEKAWEKAIEMAYKYEAATDAKMHATVAHYYCELADNLLHKNGDLNLATTYLEKAVSADKQCVRASLLFAKVNIEQQEYKTALKFLKKIKDQNPDYLSEAIDLLAHCYEQLKQEEDLVHYLKKLVEEHPRVPVVLILAERIRQWKGDKIAANFVADYVRRYPSLRGLALFIDLYISNTEGQAKLDLHIVQNLMNKILAGKPDYRCTSCGFSGKTLHWHCPGCRQWSTILPIHSLEEGFV